MNQEEAVGHIKVSDRQMQPSVQPSVQPLIVHLTQVAALCATFCEVISLPLCGELLGLMHDLGKYSQAFQQYLRAACGLMGEEAQAEALAQQGTIDHATSGAQWIWEAIGSSTGASTGFSTGFSPSKEKRALAQMLAVVVMSHHSRKGMVDYLALEGESPFLKRLRRPDEATHLNEARRRAPGHLLNKIKSLLHSPELLEEFRQLHLRIKEVEGGTVPLLCHYAFVTRFLFSALLDADRLDTANFENEVAAQWRSHGQRPDWKRLRARLEAHLASLPKEHAIAEVRSAVSEACREAASCAERLLTLTVPTGGGKTLASLRFALERAAADGPDRIDRIIYVIPYTSIIDQNAAQVRSILGEEAVLEHHSNLAPERDDWRRKVLAENWDAPVVFTTSVQLLDALFNQSTRAARRMHQLANAILIFDEVQTLPIKTVHLFNNALNFLTAHCQTTVVLCSATMPLLHQVERKYGCLRQGREIVPDKEALFRQLKRTEIIDRCRPEKWDNAAVAALARESAARYGSTLVVCNTKDSARGIYELIAEEYGEELAVIHLSTNLCPAHRKDRIREITELLKAQATQPVICVSTQLIEAGVDLDFGCVIRSLAGLDSIIQAGGRCNRHQKRREGPVYILNFAEERLGRALAEMREAQEVTERLLGEFRRDPAAFAHDLLSEAAMNRFYEYVFYRRREEMLYPLKPGRGVESPIASRTTLLHLLSDNRDARAEVNRTGKSEAALLPFHHAFSTAAQAFEVIDAPTAGIIVPYCNEKTGRDGQTLIGDLAAALGNDGVPLARQIQLLRQAQQYTVNAFPHVINSLRECHALHEVAPESGIFYLDERYYHDALGVTLEALSEQHYLAVS